MKLYIMHCGFYEATDAAAIFENHANFYVVAADFEGAKAQMKAHPTFKNKNMHIDGMQEIIAVDGYRVELTPDQSFQGKTQVRNLKYGSRAPTLAEIASTQI